MDNFGATSTSETDDTFAYVPPNLMYDRFKSSNVLPAEEAEREKFHHEELLEEEDRKRRFQSNDK